MNENKLKPGDIVKHVHFDHELFVVKILENGAIGCRYFSFHRGLKDNSERILHYMEFEPFELSEALEKNKSTGSRLLSF